MSSILTIARASLFASVVQRTERQSSELDAEGSNPSGGTYELMGIEQGDSPRNHSVTNFKRLGLCGPGC